MFRFSLTSPTLYHHGNSVVNGRCFSSSLSSKLLPSPITFSATRESSRTSGSGFRFIIAPGEPPLAIFQQEQRQQKKRASKMRISSAALQACGIDNRTFVNSSSPADPNSANNNSNDISDKLQNDDQTNNSGDKQSSGSSPAFNAAELTDDEVTRCLQLFPHFADLATTEFTTAASLRSLAADRVASPFQVRRCAIRDLKMHLTRQGLCHHSEIESLSLADIQTRFGETEVVRKWLTVWCHLFTVDVDKELSS